MKLECLDTPSGSNTPCYDLGVLPGHDRSHARRMIRAAATDVFLPQNLARNSTIERDGRKKTNETQYYPLLLLFRLSMLLFRGIRNGNCLRKGLLGFTSGLLEKELGLELGPNLVQDEGKMDLRVELKWAGFGSFSLKKALWAAAKATTVQQFIVCMNHMFELDPNTATWCNEKEPSQWTMGYFSPDAKFDMLLNNVCEVYNSMILDARDKPILTLLEKLRYLLMARMLANREKAEQWNLVGEYIPRKSNQWNYEIIGASIMDNWAVDLEKRTCSCRKWSLTGIPCKHAIAAIWAN
ncbi:hypothetical protein KY284_035349 [Solanum tuberosum]|nr:hypothetical protein KY284_035349 [Solanum tuberosum]